MNKDIEMHHIVASAAVTRNIYNCTMCVVKRVKLTLNQFMLIQFILGAEHTFTGKCIPAYVALLFKLIKVNVQPGDVTIEFEAEELRILRVFLEARLFHCEEERAKLSPNFNVDTYIQMKLMLLDLRELMMGEIVEMQP